LTRLRAVLAFAAALFVVAALARSVWLDVPHSWRLMRNERLRFAGYTSAQRAQAFGALLPIRMDIFDFWRGFLRPGDRYWIQIPDEAFSANADKRLVVRTVAHLYLLPALETRHLADATVVLSWDADPGLLHLTYSDQIRAGLQVIFASRIDRDA
jgi:hypothetical protein